MNQEEGKAIRPAPHRRLRHPPSEDDRMVISYRKQIKIKNKCEKTEEWVTDADCFGSIQLRWMQMGPAGCGCSALVRGMLWLYWCS